MSNVLADWRRQRLDSLAAAVARRRGTAGGGDNGDGGQAGDDRDGGVSLFRDALRRLARNPVAIVGAVIIAAFILVAALAPVIAPHDPVARFDELNRDLRPDNIPGARSGFLFGSDPFGRDFFSRMIYGSRQTLFVGVVATLLGLLAGAVLGTLAGAFGRWIDVVIMRFTDVMLALPGLLLAITLVAVVSKPSQWTVILAVALVNVPIFARLLRGSMLSQRESDHVVAARALGIRQGQIVLRHVLPNSLAPVLVQATLTFATAIIDAAALSFLGLGDPDTNRAEWGLMLGGDGQRYFEVRPELAYYPALAIIIVALGFTLLGESMREALDPKVRR